MDDDREMRGAGSYDRHWHHIWTKIIYGRLDLFFQSKNHVA